MKFELPLLEELCTLLEAQQQTLAAKAHEAETRTETGLALRYHARAIKGAAYVEQLREAIRRLQVRPKVDGFTPPTRAEVHEFAREKFPRWPAADIQSWFNHFESVGWVIGAGKKMKCWKSAAANGYRKWEEKNPGRKSASREEGDPPGWKEFLVFKGRNYKEFRYALPHHVEDYRAWRNKQA